MLLVLFISVAETRSRSKVKPRPTVAAVPTVRWRPCELLVPDPPKKESKGDTSDMLRLGLVLRSLVEAKATVGWHFCVLVADREILLVAIPHANCYKYCVANQSKAFSSVAIDIRSSPKSFVVSSLQSITRSVLLCLSSERSLMEEPFLCKRKKSAARAGYFSKLS